MFDLAFECLQRGRLRQVIVHACFEAGGGVAGQRVGGAGDDRQRFGDAGFRLDTTDFAREFVTVHARHVAVGQQHCEVPVFPFFQRFNAVVCQHRFIAEQRGLTFHQAQIHRMIVGDEDGRAQRVAHCLGLVARVDFLA